MRNYPDDCPSHLFGEEDMDGVEKLSCGCYEEQCECLRCKHCSEKLVDDEEKVCSGCEEE